MKFVQITPDIISIREVTEPTNDEDDGWTVHGFVGNSLYTVFGGELSPSEQFQKHYWTQIQTYFRQSYDSNLHCDVSVMVCDGTVRVSKLMVILLFPDVGVCHCSRLYFS